MAVDSFFKKLYFIGISLLTLSCFLDWYSLRITDLRGEVVAEWNYNFFFGWKSPLSDSPFYEAFNELYRPTFSLLPCSISILLVVLIIISSYIIAFNTLEKITPRTNKRVYGYGVIALPMLLIYLIWSFPWMLEDLYYPNMKITDSELGLVTVYTIGLGNILVIISFPFIFAYSFFYFMTIFRFEKKESTHQTKVQSLIENSQQDLDLDTLIATEKLKIIDDEYRTNNKYNAQSIAIHKR
ncbi:MAG: hypothetical protein ACFFC3_03700 [Candidatus Odinarchaeota archaeon]